MNNNKKNYIKILLVLLLFVTAGVIFSCSMKNRAKNADETVVELEEESSLEEESFKQPIAELVCVHVCGCVNLPGVYYLEQGARIHEAIELAGGMTEEADPEYVNLAREAEDGAQIYIPSREEVSEGIVPEQGAEALEAGDGLVNINTAALEELKTLPGIGEIKAEAIISYRESVGSFASIEEIMNVAGIKESSYEKIKEHIKV